MVNDALLQMGSRIVPFVEAQQVCKTLKFDLANQRLTLDDPQARPVLPGQPLVQLDIHHIASYLRNELLTPKLDKLSERRCLWLVATPSSEEISALHDQIVRGRQVTITEDPELHLVWVGDQIFLKPLPFYLFSHGFWQYVFCIRHPPGEEEGLDLLYKSALGFMRSYSRLIRHESDYRLAVAYYLIPKEITFEEFCLFIEAFSFSNVANDKVSPRYDWGQLRLARLNFWSKFFGGPHKFKEISWSYELTFSKLYAPILFVFGIVTLLLSAMQVALAADPQPANETATQPANRRTWDVFPGVSKWFSIVVIFGVVAIGLYMFLKLIYMGFSEIIFVIKAIIRRRRLARNTVPPQA